MTTTNDALERAKLREAAGLWSQWLSDDDVRRTLLRESLVMIDGGPARMATIYALDARLKSLLRDAARELGIMNVDDVVSYWWHWILDAADQIYNEFKPEPLLTYGDQVDRQAEWWKSQDGPLFRKRPHPATLPLVDKLVSTEAIAESLTAHLTSTTTWDYDLVRFLVTKEIERVLGLPIKSGANFPKILRCRDYEFESWLDEVSTGFHVAWELP